MTSRPKVELHIERVVVHGIALSVAERKQLQRALERQLAQLLEVPRAPKASGARTLQAPTIAADAHTSAEQLGRDSARSLYALIWGAP